MSLHIEYISQYNPTYCIFAFIMLGLTLTYYQSQRMNMKTQYKPGEVVKTSGQYLTRGARGGNLKKEVTCTKGEPFPPTPKKKQTYELADATKHKKS